MDPMRTGRYSPFFELAGVREVRGARHCELALLEPSGGGGQTVFVDAMVAGYHIFECERFCLHLESLPVSALHVSLYEADESQRFVPVWRSLIFEHLSAAPGDGRYEAYTALLRSVIDPANTHGSEAYQRLAASIELEGFDGRFPVVVLREHRRELGRRVTHVIDGQHRLAAVYHLSGDVEVPCLRLEREAVAVSKGAPGPRKRFGVEGRQTKQLCTPFGGADGSLDSDELENHPAEPAVRQQGGRVDLGLFARDFQRRLDAVLEELDLERLDQAVALIEAARKRGLHVLTIGNGGSAALAAHFASDLTMMASPGPSKVKAVSLSTNLSVLTAWANDTEFSQIFVRQLENLAAPGDLVIAISSSGRSKNVIAAIEWARANHLPTIGLVGFDGGPVRELVDCALWLPSRDYAIVESAHGAVIHLLASYLGALFTEPTQR